MNQNAKLIALFLLLASFATMSLGFIPKASAQPATGNLLIKIYPGPAAEEAALAAGNIDINDWPLSKTFIDANVNNPAITLNEYAEIGEIEFDLNNQLWPTGPITSPRTDPKNVFFDPAGERDIAALHFRRAIAHLSNKAKFTTNFLGGHGYVMETIVPVPALEGFTDYASLENETAKADRADNPYSSRGFIYEYNVAAAKKELELGGFMDWDNEDGDGNTATGAREWSSDGGTTWEELPNMKLWARFDDPNRRLAGLDLYNELLAVGIPPSSVTGADGLDLQIATRSTSFTAVMVNYDYNIYTGGWSLTPDPDWIFDLFHSSMGQYGYASNYPGFKNHDFDPYAEAVKYAPTLSDIRNLAIQAQWVLNKYVAGVWLWAAKGVKGYRTGYENVVNFAGFGTDNEYSFDLMEWNPALGGTRSGPPNTIVYGFMNDISALSVINSEWLWDWNVLGLIYDSLIARNPYSLAEEVGALATSWNVTDSYPGWADKTVAEYTVRTDATFHDGSLVKPADVAFSLLSVRDAGSDNAWNYPTVMDVNKVEIQGQVVRVFFNVKSAFALHWAGFMPIINKDLWWQAIGAGTPADYNNGFIPDADGTYTGGSFTTPSAIRDYHPWEVDDYGNPSIIDLVEDGSGPWKFASYVTGLTVSLAAYTNFYTTIYRKTPPTYTSMTIGTFVNLAFHGIGNVNYPGGYGDTRGWYDSPIAGLDFNPSSTYGDWINPANAYSSNNQYATAGTTGAMQQYSNYDTDYILAEQIIISVELGIEAFSSVSGASVSVTVSWDGGTSWASEKSVSLSTTDPDSETWLSFTEATTWDSTKLSDTNFRARVTAIFGATLGTIRLDWIPLRIYIEGASRKIDLYDLILIATSMPSDMSGTWGPGYNEYNPDADIDESGEVNVIDLATAGVNYNKKMG